MTNKKQQDEISQTGWRISRETREKFVVWCDSMGTKAQDDCAGALVVWPFLPSSIRERAKMVAKEIIPHDDDYWKKFQDMVLKVEICLNKGKKGNEPTSRPRGRSTP